MAKIRNNFQVCSEDKNDCVSVGQRLQWKHDPQQGDFTNVHQDAAIDELQEIHFDKHLKDNLSLTGFQRLATILNPIRDPSLKGNQAEGALNGLSLGLTGFQRIGMSSPVLRHRELTF